MLGARRQAVAAMLLAEGAAITGLGTSLAIALSIALTLALNGAAARSLLHVAVPLRFSVPLGELPNGPYECQVTVLDTTGQKAAFWRAPIVLVP